MKIRVYKISKVVVNDTINTNILFEIVLLLSFNFMDTLNNEKHENSYLMNIYETTVPFDTHLLKG